MRSSASIPLYLALVFAGGAAVGAFGHRLYTAKTVAATAPERRQSADEWRKSYLVEARERLKLTDAQASEIALILEKTGQKYREFRERTRPPNRSMRFAQCSKKSRNQNTSCGAPSATPAAAPAALRSKPGLRPGI